MTDRSEFVFTDHAPGASTDMEALQQAFDTNQDHILDSADAQWNEFAIWQDLNSNGVSEIGEVRSLDEWGIESVGLTNNGDNGMVADGVYVHGYSEVIMRDGTTTTAADSEFSFYGTEQTEVNSAPSSSIAAFEIISLQADEVMLEDGTISTIDNLRTIREDNWASETSDLTELFQGQNQDDSYGVMINADHGEISASPLLASYFDTLYSVSNDHNGVDFSMGLATDILI